MMYMPYRYSQMGGAVGGGAFQGFPITGTWTVTTKKHKKSKSVKDV